MKLSFFVPFVCVAFLTGCARGVESNPNLKEWAQSIKNKKTGSENANVPILDQAKVFSYQNHMQVGGGTPNQQELYVTPNTDAKLRNPFSFPANSNADATGLRPDPDRTRQQLEGFPLDSLKMVGTIGPQNRTALVMAPDKVVYRVNPGQYLGQQDGRVIYVHPNEISLVEIVPDGSGGWMERETSMTMDE